MRGFLVIFFLCVWVFGDVLCFCDCLRTLPQDANYRGKPDARGCEKGAFWLGWLSFGVVPFFLSRPVAAENREFASVLEVLDKRAGQLSL